MSKFIIYQGYEEQYRWRLVDDEGNMVSQSELLDSVDEAIKGAEKVNPDLEIENRVVEEEE